MLVGWLATGDSSAAPAQLAVGRLIERFPPHLLFAAVVTVQFLGIVWCGHASGATLVAALAVLLLVAIYAQVTVGDIIIALHIADAWAPGASMRCGIS